MKERVLLVVVTPKMLKDEWRPEDIADEMKELVKACGGEVVNTVFSKLDKPTAGYLITTGKVEEIAQLCGMGDIDLVIFSADLKGSQQRNLEEEFDVKTIDRTQLILDIFARHAKSLEGKMQVELAQLQYMLPRLAGTYVELSRLGGGIGTVGPGETKLEVDRRRISTRISKLKKDLAAIVQGRQMTRKKRKTQHIPTVSLVGYTNAGKSTLLNALTGANQKTQDGLFTTLDSLSRQVTLPNKRQIILSDTVGFMHDLPHHLIESFKATLEEVQAADVLLHVVDVSHPKLTGLYDSVEDVLGQLEVLDKPTITVFNKMDREPDREFVEWLEQSFENPVFVSALNGENIDELLIAIEDILAEDLAEINAVLPMERMDLVNLAHKEGRVLSIEYKDDGIHLKALLPQKIAGRFDS